MSGRTTYLLGLALWPGFLSLLALPVTTCAAESYQLCVVIVEDECRESPGIPIVLLRDSSKTITRRRADRSGRCCFDGLPIGTYDVSSSHGPCRGTILNVSLTEDAECSIELLPHSVSERLEVEPAALPVESSPDDVAVQGDSVTTLPLRNDGPTNLLGYLPHAVVPDSKVVSVAGAAPDQNSVIVDGFDLVDPMTGQTALDLPLESMRRLAAGEHTSRHAARGGAQGGWLEMETIDGLQPRSWGVSTIFPKFTFYDGLGFRFLLWNPSAQFVIPLSEGESGFAVGTEYLLFEPRIVELPTEANSTTTRTAKGFLRFDHSIGEQPGGRHRIGVFLAARDTETEAFGLSVLNPAATTTLREHRGSLAGVSYDLDSEERFGITTRVSLLRVDSTVQPYGSEPYLVTPEGASGNYFLAETRSGRTVRAVQEISFGAGDHTLVGVLEYQQSKYTCEIQERDVFFLRGDGTLRRRTTFERTELPEIDLSAFALGLQHVYSPAALVELRTELRASQADGLAGWAYEPLIALQLSPGDESPLLFELAVAQQAGRVPLYADLYSFLPSQQSWDFPDQGGSDEPVRFSVSRSRPDELDHPYTRSVDLGGRWSLDQEWEIGLKATWRSSRNQLAVSVDGAPDPEHRLESSGSSHYRALLASFRRPFSNGWGIEFSYTYAVARSNHSPWLSPMTGDEEPFPRLGPWAPGAWDARHRLLAWGLAQTGERWRCGAALRWRSGLPYSAYDSVGEVVGTPSSHRFPPYFAIDLVIQHQVEMLDEAGGALRLKLFNVTGRGNPHQVNSNIESRNFGEYSEEESVGFILEVVLG